MRVCGARCSVRRTGKRSKPPAGSSCRFVVVNVGALLRPVPIPVPRRAKAKQPAAGQRRACGPQASRGGRPLASPKARPPTAFKESNKPRNLVASVLRPWPSPSYSHEGLKKGTSKASEGACARGVGH
jgi:hypothetical protein